MLKEHNREAYEATKNMLLKHRECCLVAATGIGKSNITTELIQELGLNALIIAPRAAIRDNWTDMPSKYDIPPTFSVVTYQYFVKHYENLYGFDAYIFDEAHHTDAPKWGTAIRKFREGLDTEFVLGLTADPNRYSDKNKRDKEDKIITSVVRSVFNDHAVYGHDQRSAIKNGILPRATYVCSIYNADEMFDRYEAMDLTEELRGRLNYTRTNCEAIEDTLRRNIPKVVPVKGIVFVDSINNIDIGVRLARRAFPREAVHYIHSKLSTAENAETLEMFKNAKSGFIVSVDMIGEGLHIDGVNTVIMLRKTGSPSIYTQQIGRGLAAGSNDVTIFDFVRNDTSIKKVLARIKSMNDSYDQKDEEIKDTEISNRGSARYPKISDQFIVKDKATGILEIFDEIDKYIRLRSRHMRDDIWTLEEDEILRKNYPTMGNNTISLLPNRTEDSIYKHAAKLGLKSSFRPALEWTLEEDEILRKNYPTMGSGVFTLLSNRSERACVSRARRLGISCNKRIRNAWTPEEDEILKENFPIMGSDVYKMIPNRSRDSCVDRAYMFGLKILYKWTPEEDEILRKNYPTMGSDVVELLQNRSRRACVARAGILQINVINTDVWTDAEDNIIRSVYPIVGRDVYKLLQNRTKSACATRAKKLGVCKTAKWTLEEDEILRKNYPTMGSDVYKMIPGRTKHSCMGRAEKLKILCIAHQWTPEEDEILRKNYPTMGSKVADLLPGRSKLICRSRASTLNVKIRSNREWTTEEDEILKENFPIMGPKVMSLLPNRTWSAIRNRVTKFKIKYIGK